MTLDARLEANLAQLEAMADELDRLSPQDRAELVGGMLRGFAHNARKAAGLPCLCLSYCVDGAPGTAFGEIRSRCETCSTLISDGEARSSMDGIEKTLLDCGAPPCAECGSVDLIGVEGGRIKRRLDALRPMFQHAFRPTSYHERFCRVGECAEATK